MPSTADAENLPILVKHCDATKREVFSQIRSKIPIWLFIPSMGLVLALLWIVWETTADNERRLQDMRVEVSQMNTLIANEFKHQGEKLSELKQVQETEFRDIKTKLDKLPIKGS